MPSFEDFIIPDSASANFNEWSTDLQRLAKVNPDRCIKIATVEGEDRTSLDLFFSALETLTWISPKRGEWRDHDMDLHWRGVRQMHPKGASVVVWAARIGNGLLDADYRDAAEYVASTIDLFVDRTTRTSEYYDLLGYTEYIRKYATGAHPRMPNPPDHEILADHRIAMMDLEMEYLPTGAL